MAEYTIGANVYQTRKMNVFDQLHVTRALLPIIAKIGPEFITNPDSIKNLMDKLVPAFEELAGMDEEKVNAIIYKCMACVSRRQGPAWAPVFNTRVKMMAFEDIEFTELLELTMYVLSESISRFSFGGGSASPAVTSPASGPLPNSFSMTRP